jgi:Na+/H+-dicarboxylate symporter
LRKNLATKAQPARSATRREPLLGFFQSVVDSLLVLVRWILIIAPIGVFVLALGVGLRGGIGAAGAIVHYLVLVCSLSILVTLLLYPVAVFVAGIGLRRSPRRRSAWRWACRSSYCRCCSPWT